MLYAVRENSEICCNWFDETVSRKASDTYRLFTGDEPKRGVSLNAQLLAKYGKTTQFGKEFQQYEIAALKPGKWHCDECGADIVQSDGMSEFSIYYPDGDFMGNVFRFGLQSGMQAARRLDDGHCPICEEWDTGAECFCNRNGFAKTEGMFVDMKRLDRL